MGNLSRSIRRNQARLVIGEHEARKGRKNKKSLKIIPGKSKVLAKFWQKIQIDTHGYWPWRKNRVACDPKQRKGAVIFPIQYAGRTK